MRASFFAPCRRTDAASVPSEPAVGIPAVQRHLDRGCNVFLVFSAVAQFPLSKGLMGGHRQAASLEVGENPQIGEHPVLRTMDLRQTHKRAVTHERIARGGNEMERRSACARRRSVQGKASWSRSPLRTTASGDKPCRAGPTRLNHLQMQPSED
jgi:hypothetical protein